MPIYADHWNGCGGMYILKNMLAFCGAQRLFSARELNDRFIYMCLDTQTYKFYKRFQAQYSGEPVCQQWGSPLWKYFILRCLGRGLDLDLRVRPAAPFGNQRCFKTRVFVVTIIQKTGPGHICDFSKPHFVCRNLANRTRTFSQIWNFQNIMTHPVRMSSY